MMPTANKIELFARNNNLRRGWLSLGNQLGANYINLKDDIHCDSCGKEIQTEQKRFKSKVTPSVDWCETCFKKKGDSSEFFCLENNIEEDNLHEYLKCNMCDIEPICGPRFQCKVCQDVDLCE